MLLLIILSKPIIYICFCVQIKMYFIHYSELQGKSLNNMESKHLFLKYGKTCSQWNKKFGNGLYRKHCVHVHTHMCVYRLRLFSDVSLQYKNCVCGDYSLFYIMIRKCECTALIKICLDYYICGYINYKYTLHYLKSCIYFSLMLNFNVLMYWLMCVYYLIIVYWAFVMLSERYI